MRMKLSKFPGSAEKLVCDETVPGFDKPFAALPENFSG